MFGFSPSVNVHLQFFPSSNYFKLADFPHDHFQMLDPDGIANWSVTHVDWSEGKWHPKSYRAQDVTYELMKNITVRLCFSLFCISLIHVALGMSTLAPLYSVIWH